MKNVTKILTAVVLCAAVFASTNRTDALGGNSAFWPGDEANISAFPAQINNHSYVQFSGVNGAVAGYCDDGVSENEMACDGAGGEWTEGTDTQASASMVFNHNGTSWGLGFSDSADDWINLKWGKNDMGVSFTLMNSDDFTGDTDDYVPNTSSWVVSGSCAGAETVSGTLDDPQPASQALCEDVGLDTPGTWTDTSSCSEGGTGDANGCDNGAGTAAFNTTAEGMALSFGKVYSWGEIGFHYTDGDDWENGMAIDFRKSCGFWVFTDMVASLEMPDWTDFGDDNVAGGVDGDDCEDDDTCNADTVHEDMLLGADWFTHWDASGSDVMFAMGFDYDSGSGQLNQTAAIGVEANMTDWASFRAGVNWNYQVMGGDGDDEDMGAFNYGWATGLGFNWGGFTADLSVEDELLADPVGHMTGYAGSLTNSTIQLTYSF